ncbi:NfeD family protein [Actinopolymorpha pittospori]
MGNLLAWINDHLWVAWTVIAVALATIELLTIDLVFLMLAAGAAAGAITALVGGGPAISIIVAIVVALGMLAAVRPVALRHLREAPMVRMGISALVGKKGLVVEQVHPHGGRVKIEGEIWTARPYDEHSTIEPGKSVDVLSIEGVTAFVHESEQPW